VELNEFIRFVKEEVRNSEDPKPENGFWTGAQSLEITFETVTEIKKEPILEQNNTTDSVPHKDEQDFISTRNYDGFISRINV